MTTRPIPLALRTVTALTNTGQERVDLRLQAERWGPHVALSGVPSCIVLYFEQFFQSAKIDWSLFSKYILYQRVHQLNEATSLHIQNKLEFRPTVGRLEGYCKCSWYRSYCALRDPFSVWLELNGLSNRLDFTSPIFMNR
jgi:hypothetical protein